MKNMDKGLIVPKWVLINHLKIPQMPPNCLGQPKSLGFYEKKALLGVRSPCCAPFERILKRYKR